MAQWKHGKCETFLLLLLVSLLLFFSYCTLKLDELNCLVWICMSNIVNGVANVFDVPHAQHFNWSARARALFGYRKSIQCWILACSSTFFWGGNTHLTPLYITKTVNQNNPINTDFRWYSHFQRNCIKRFEPFCDTAQIASELDCIHQKLVSLIPAVFFFKLSIFCVVIYRRGADLILRDIWVNLINAILIILIFEGIGIKTTYYYMGRQAKCYLVERRCPSIWCQILVWEKF